MKRKRFSIEKKNFKSGRVVKVARKDPALSRINEHAAGIDIGAESHFVAVPPSSCPTPVRQFGVFTRDLYAIADWLKGRLNPLMHDLLAPDRLKNQGLFDAAFVQKLIREHETNAASHHKQLWTLLVFQLWYDNFLIKK